MKFVVEAKLDRGWQGWFVVDAESESAAETEMRRRLPMIRRVRRVVPLNGCGTETAEQTRRAPRAEPLEPLVRALI